MLRISYVVLLFALAATLSAQTVIYTDFANTPDDWGYVVSFGPLGQSFTTGSTAYNLTSVTVILSNQSEDAVDASPARGAGRAVRAMRAHAISPSRVHPNPAPVAPSTVVMLYSDNGGPGPGTLLATSTTVLLDTSLTGAAQQFAFQFSPYPLAANTRYWILVTSPGGNSVAQWWGSDGPTGAVTSEYYESSYLDDTSAVYPVNGDTEELSFAFELQVSGTSNAPATPAPPSALLVLLGLCGAGLYFGRQRLGLTGKHVA